MKFENDKRMVTLMMKNSKTKLKLTNSLSSKKNSHCENISEQSTNTNSSVKPDASSTSKIPFVLE